MQPDAEGRLRATRRSRRPSVIESIPRHEHECLAFPDRQSAYRRHQFWIRFLLFGVVDLPAGERRKALVECGLSPMSAPGVSDQIPRRHEQPGNGVLWYVLEASPGRQEGFRDDVLDVVKGGSSRDVSSDTRRMGLPEELEPSFSVVSQAEPPPFGVSVSAMSGRPVLSGFTQCVTSRGKRRAGPPRSASRLRKTGNDLTDLDRGPPTLLPVTAEFPGDEDHIPSRAGKEFNC
jgi:hypothetical protein